jgi:hypothetical protein
MLHLVGLMVQSLLILLIVCAILIGVVYLFRIGAEFYIQYEIRRDQRRAYESLQDKLTVYRRKQEGSQIFKKVEECRNDFE